MEEQRSESRRQAWVAALLVVLVGAIPAIGLALAGADLRGNAADVLLRARDAGRPAPTSVLLIKVDGRSVFKYHALPLPRRIYGEAIERLDAAGAKAVGIDVQFTEPSSHGNADDLALFNAIDDARVPVILATSEVIHRRGKPVDTGVLGGNANLKSIGAVAAHSAAPLSDDGKWRTAVPRIEGLSTFANAIARAAGGPGVPDGGMLIDPTLPADRLPSRSLRDLLEGKVPAADIRGRAVIIGAMAPGPNGDDRWLMAGSPDKVYGVQMHTEAVATALAGAPLTAAPGVSWLLAFLGVLLSAVATARRRLGQLVLVVGGSIVLVGVICWVAVRHGWLIDPILPWLVLLFGGGTGIAYRALAERRARAVARATLSRFVPPGVVDDLLREGSDGRLAPHAQTATVMFCDLRGYTALTAGLARPDALVDVLDAYLGAVSRVVYAHGGTVVSFQGDGVMAAFGVPVDDGQAALHAVAAARELLGEALPQLREELGETLGAGPAGALALGIGIATGPVFAGTVGPSARREYAVVGPTTNLAARLQARTKEEAGPTLIDDATAAAVLGEARSAAHTGVRTPDGPLRPLGPREIRGLERAVDCWTLAS